LHRLTIWNQKFNQHIPEESALKLGLFFSDFEDYSKSAQGMILFLLVTYSHTPILPKNAEKPTVIRLFTQNCFKSTVLGSNITYLLGGHDYFLFWAHRELFSSFFFQVKEDFL